MEYEQYNIFGGTDKMSTEPKDKKAGFIEVETIKYRNNTKIIKKTMVRADSITVIDENGGTIYIYIDNTCFEVNISYAEFKNKLKLL